MKYIKKKKKKKWRKGFPPIPWFFGEEKESEGKIGMAHQSERRVPPTPSGLNKSVDLDYI